MSEYRLLNIVLAGVLGLIFLYSGFFVSTDYAINCSYKSQFGVDCVSCGFSRDFASFTHLDFGKKLNQYSSGVFLFCFIQFVIRVFLVFQNKLKENKYARIDVWFSLFLLVVLVGPYFIAYFNFFIELMKLGVEI